MKKKPQPQTEEGLNSEAARLVGEMASLRFDQLRRQGDRIAKSLGYTEHKGIEAVKFYLVQTHHWLPSVVNSLSLGDLDFCISEFDSQHRDD